MSGKKVVVDGSNIATEGRSTPSLRQLDEAVRAFLEEFDDVDITVVVDATFGHRIDDAERPEFDAAEAAGELVSPPAGAIGRGDAFLLRIADRVGAMVFSNDSFQEFHGEYEWLFDKDRLIGGKPVPGIGWIFTPRTPVRGAKSREAVKEAKRARVRVGSKEASLPMPVPTQPPPALPRRAAATTAATPGGTSAAAATGQSATAAAAADGQSGLRATRTQPKDKAMARAIAEATEEGLAPDSAKAQRRRRKRGTGPSPQALNDPLSFITFIADHPLGGEVEGEVDSFSSHGAFILAGGATCYVPLIAMGDPPPRSARDLLSKGERRTFIVQALDTPRRGIELALPEFAHVSGAPSDETVEAEITEAPRGPAEAAAADEPADDGPDEAAASAPELQPVSEPAPAPAAAARARRGTKKAAQAEPSPEGDAEAAAPSRARRSTRKAAADATADETAAATSAPAGEAAATPTRRTRGTRKSGAAAEPQTQDAAATPQATATQGVEATAAETAEAAPAPAKRARKATSKAAAQADAEAPATQEAAAPAKRRRSPKAAPAEVEVPAAPASVAADAGPDGQVPDQATAEALAPADDAPPEAQPAKRARRTTKKAAAPAGPDESPSQDAAPEAPPVKRARRTTKKAADPSPDAAGEAAPQATPAPAETDAGAATDGAAPAPAKRVRKKATPPQAADVVGSEAEDAAPVAKRTRKRVPADDDVTTDPAPAPAPAPAPVKRARTSAAAKAKAKAEPAEAAAPAADGAAPAKRVRKTTRKAASESSPADSSAPE